MNYKLGLIGGVGGMAPPLLAIAIRLTGGDQNLPHWTFLIGVVILFGFGCFMAVATKADDIWKAFFIGVSMPATITSMVGAALPNSGSPPSYLPPRTEISIVSPALAQADTVTSAASGRLVHFVAPSSEGQFQLWFLDSSGKLLPAESIPGSAQTYLAPANAAAVTVFTPEGWTKRDELPDSHLGQDVTIKVKKRTEFWTGILQGFGAGRSAAFDVDISSAP